MNTRGRSGWIVYVALLPMVTISIAQAARRADWAQLWPVWRPMFLDLTLLVAAATLATAAVAGVVAWRQAAR